MNIDKEFDNFMEFPSEAKDYVTSTSAKLFARYWVAKVKRETEDDGNKNSHKCVNCKNIKPLTEMKTCMHNGMHRYVCSTKCMREFYK